MEGSGFHRKVTNEVPQAGPPRRVVTVVARGATPLPTDIWRTLAASPELWGLVDRHILGISHTGKSEIELTAGAFVGRALVDDVVVEVIEKVEGSLVALIGFASSGSFRLEKHPAPASEVGSLTRFLVNQFLEEVRNYVSAGREFQYVSKMETGSLAGGRLLVGQTAMLWARGLQHLLAFERSLPTRKTPLNRTLLAALREIDEIANAASISSADLMAARGFAELFSDCLDAEVLYAPADRFVQLADELIDRSEDDQIRDMLSLAAVVLSHEGFEPGAYMESTVPRSWFLNLENLFQRAVRRVLDRVGRPWLRVSTAAPWLPSIFSSVPKELRAHPDLVLHHQGEFFAVGDVKYKTLTGRPDEDDLYQLVVHAAAFRTDVAFLVYPADSFSVTDLGLSATGCKTWVFEVDIRHLKEDLQRVLQVLDLT
jgi:5-methylcytosine-specific restriction endonuclease McrBC regulatory subunit McrC